MSRRGGNGQSHTHRSAYGKDRAEDTSRRKRERKRRPPVAAVNPLIEEGLRLQREKARRQQEEEQDGKQQQEQEEENKQEEKQHKAVGWLPFAFRHLWSSSSLLDDDHSLPPPPATAAAVTALSSSVAGRVTDALRGRELGLFSFSAFPTRCKTLFLNLPILRPSTRLVSPPSALAEDLFHGQLSSLDLCCHAAFGVAVATPRMVAFYQHGRGQQQADVLHYDRSLELFPGQVKASMAVAGDMMRTFLLHNQSSSSFHQQQPAYCTARWILKRSQRESYEVETIHLPYGDVVDYGSVICWNQSASALYLSSLKGLVEIRLEEARQHAHYPVHRQRGPSHLTALCPDDLQSSQGDMTLWAGCRNGSVHRIDLRKGWIHSQISAQRNMKFCVDKVATMPLHGNLLVASDVSNEIALFDVRSLSHPVRVLQKGVEGGLKRNGFWLTADEEMIVARYNASKKNEKGPMRLAYLSTWAEHDRFGAPVSLRLSDCEEFGTFQLAHDCTVGSKWSHAQDPLVRADAEVCWGVCSPSDGNVSSTLRLFTLGQRAVDVDDNIDGLERREAVS
eukprot:gene1150-1255_t